MRLLFLVVYFGVALALRLVSPPSIGQQFQRRQVSIPSESSAPSQCASTCGPINNEISLGCPDTDCCSTSFENQYYNCLECVGTALGAGSYVAGQNSLNLLHTTCVDLGYVLPQLVLPGQSANSSSSTSAGVASSTHTSGAVISGRWRDVQALLLSSTAALLWMAGLW